MTEIEQGQSMYAQNYEVDLGRLIKVLWAGKWLIGGVSFVAAAIAVIVALSLPDIYKAEVLLAPNEKDRAGGLSALAAQYGGLASLAGIDFGGGSSDKTSIALEVLRSRKFISEFIEGHNILVPLVAANGWSAETGQIKVDPDVYDIDSAKWVRAAKPPRDSSPSLQEAYAEFMRILSVNQDKSSGLVRVSVEHYSPIVAKQWVDWIVEDINANVMQQDVLEAEQAIAYLNDQVANTSLAGLQGVFFKLIEEQTKVVMLAKVSPEYMFRTLDPAVIPEMKEKPKRSLLVVLATFIGVLLGIVIHIFRSLDILLGRSGLA